MATSNATESMDTLCDLMNDLHISQEVDMKDKDGYWKPYGSDVEMQPYMDGSRTGYLDMLLRYAYASCLKPIIRDLAEKTCEGCLESYPSQRDHECIMTPFDDLVEFWFDIALDKLDESKAIELWFVYLARVQPKVRYHEMSPFLDVDWRWDCWIDEDWKQDLTEKLGVLHENPSFLEELVPVKHE